MSTQVQQHGHTGDGAATKPLRVLLYSDDRAVRERVRLAAGRRVAKDLPELEWVETATRDAVHTRAAKESFDLLVLDGEAAKNGGMGLCRELKNEIFRCPPVLVLIGRPQDAWLASWSNADAVVPHPLDPVEVQDAMAALLRATPGSATA